MRKFNLAVVWLILSAAMGGNASKAAIKPADTAHFYTKHSYDVLKYKLDINLYQCYQSPYPKAFTAMEDVTFMVDSALSFIQLNANTASMDIDSVSLAGTSFTHLTNILTVNLDRAYQHGEIVNVRIFYRHKNTNDHGFYASSGFVFTDSPPEGARKWVPCWDRPSDKATWELNAKVPLNVRLGSTGRLADSTISGDTIRYHWVSEIPVSTYLISFTSSVNYLIRSLYWHTLANPSDSIPIRIYHKANESLAVIDATILPLTTFFAEKFGDYPFEKIGFATLNGSFPWGGMENQTMVNLMPGGYSDANLIAHEHSHQWFADLITCGTWADIWLNEGFRTYCQNLWLEHSAGFEAYKSSMNTLANYYLSHNPGWSLYHPEWAIQTPDGNTLYNEAISYNKGACVLFQLRYVLGDSVFFQLMHDYATDTNLMYKNVYTQDFVEKADQISGQNLDWFFNEWVYGPNHPVYQNTVAIDSIGESLWRVSLQITQTQINAEFFKMPVEVRIRFQDATDTIVQVVNDVNYQNFDFTFSKRPVSFEFDPYRNILLKQAATVVNAPNPFKDATFVSYEVASERMVTISVLDSNGNMLNRPVNSMHLPGLYRLEWANPGLSPGNYFLKMEAGDFTDTKKILLIR
ncbi:MAG: M1 family aminopeptidase [Bacteroidetes bacterium]|nr:M1 family aminopeptidase [Bacteroidota bacterium]